MKVQEVMTSGAIACAPETNLEAAALLMWDNDCGVLPVVTDDGRVVSMITDRDICMATALNHRAPGDIPVAEVVTGKVYSCNPEDDVREALGTMLRERVRRLPVVTSDGTLAGIISINDVVLKAQEGTAGDASQLSYADVVSAFKGICTHHTLPPVPEQEMLQKAATT